MLPPSSATVTMAVTWASWIFFILANMSNTFHLDTTKLSSQALINRVRHRFKSTDRPEFTVTFKQQLFIRAVQKDDLQVFGDVVKVVYKACIICRGDRQGDVFVPVLFLFPELLKLGKKFAHSEAILARQTLSQAIADSFICRNRPERYKPATRQQPKTEYPAQVFQGIHGRTFTGTGHAGHQHEVFVHISSIRTTGSGPGTSCRSLAANGTLSGSKTATPMTDSATVW